MRRRAWQIRQLQPKPLRRPRLPSVARRALWPVVYVVFGLALAAAAAGAVADIAEESGPAAIAKLGVALVLLLFQLAALALVWVMLLREVEPRSRLRTALVAQSFVLGWVGRYLPGVADIAGKYFACRRAREIRAERVRAAILYEQLLQLAVMLLLPALTVGFVFPAAGWWATPMLLAGAAALASAVASRRIMSALLRPIERVLGRRPRPARVPRVRGIVVAGGLQAAGSLIGALAFHAVAVVMTDWPPEAVAASAFAYGAATLCGYVVPLLPAGAGARELTLTWLLSPVVGPGPAFSVAVVSRAVAVIADATLGVTALVWFTVQSRLTAHHRAWGAPELATALDPNCVALEGDPQMTSPDAGERREAEILLVTAWHLRHMRSMPYAFWNVRKLDFATRGAPGCLWVHRWVSRRSVMLTTCWASGAAAADWLASAAFRRTHAAVIAITGTVHRRERYATLPEAVSNAVA